jgi:hypothetical protein
MSCPIPDQISWHARSGKALWPNVEDLASRCANLLYWPETATWNNWNLLQLLSGVQHTADFQDNHTPAS